MASLEDRIEDLPEPAMFKKYFDFLLWKWGRYMIVGWWVTMMILGLSYGFELLNLTDFEFKPPAGTEAYDSQQEFRDKFHSIASTNDLIVYYSCQNAECNTTYPITSERLQMENMSIELNATLMSYAARHSNIIYGYSDFYSAKAKCKQYFKDAEYLWCYSEIQQLFISSEGKSAVGSIRYDGEAESSDAKKMCDYINKECKRISKQYGNRIVVKFTGQTPMVQDMSKASRDDVEKKDVYTIPLALCVLAVVVKTWRTMFIPLVCVFGSMCTSFSIMRPVAEYGFTINPFAPSIMTSVTVAMSIDYSLFLLTRFREEIEKQHSKGVKVENLDVVYAVRQVTRWSGKVVAFSGFILSITYVGLVAYPMSMLQSVGLGTSIAVLCTILINLTLTPALLLMFPNFFRVLGCRLPEICERALARVGIHLPSEDKPTDEKYEQFIDQEETSLHDHMLKVQPTGNGEMNINSQPEKPHDTSAAHDDGIHPFEIPKDERDNWCNRCWFECGSYSTVWPYSIIIIIVVYALIAPIGWRIAEMRKQLDDTLIFPRDSDYLATYNEVEDDFSPGMLAAWYIIIPDPAYEEGNPEKTVRSWTYVQDTGEIMSQLYDQLRVDGYPMSSSLGISVFNNRTFPDITYYKQATTVEAYNDFSSNFISLDNSTTYFKMISAFDPYYTNAIDFVTHARNVIESLCATAAVSNTSYTCYLTGGSTNEVDLVNTIFSQFPYVLLVIVIVVFCVMGGFFASAFVPLRLFVTIAVPLTLVYGLSILVYQKGLLDGWGWAALGNTDGLFWLSPVMTVTILIGLALDYDVFLFARVYEYRVQGVPTREAIVRGVYNTGSIITAAGVIMAIAFCGLLFSQITSLNQTGFILVVAVLVDTFIIRTLLVPAVLSMAKEINWWPGIKTPARKVSNERPSIALYTSRYDNPTLDEEVVM